MKGKREKKNGNNVQLKTKGTTIFEYTLLFFYKDQQKKSQAGKEIEIATNKLTTMSLNIG